MHQNQVERQVVNAPIPLSDSARRRVSDSVPVSTRIAYGGDWRRFTQWCHDSGRVALPTSPECLAEYTDFLAEQGKAPSTIARAMAAVATAHRSSGHDRPDTVLARAVLRSHRRERASSETGNTVRKAAPMTVSALRQMIAVLDTQTLVGLRDRCLLVLGFSLGARRSELVDLNFADVEKCDEGLCVIVRTSKTDKDSVGREVSVPYGSNIDTCPVRTVLAWVAALAEAGRTAGPLFLRVDRHGNLGSAPGRADDDGRLTGQGVARIVRRTAERAGLDPNAAWSGHSLRRGFATESYRAGADPLRIGRHGGWKDGSPVLLGYIEEVDRWQANPLTGVGL